MFLIKLIKASRPPAEAPMTIIGNLSSGYLAEDFFLFLMERLRLDLVLI